MSSKKQKLEPTWVGKEDRPRLEPRILLEEHGKSYHAKTYTCYFYQTVKTNNG